MNNNDPTPPPAPAEPAAPQPEPTLDELKSQVSAKSALIEAQKAQIHEFQLTVANLRKEADAGKALEAQFAEARARWEAESLEAAKRASDEADKARSDFTAQLAAKDEEISALKAAAKTAEQIAAAKYGAGLPAPLNASPSATSLRERITGALGNAKAFAALAKELTPAQIASL